MSSSDKKLTDGENGSLKKGKKKQKGEDAWRPEGPRDPFAMLDALPETKQQEIQRALHLFSLGHSLPKTLQQAKRHTYRFWDTQPVPKLDESITEHGPIAESGTGVRDEPYSLPQGFSWDNLDLSSPPVLRELCSFLNESYMEEDDNSVRFDFRPEYLQCEKQVVQVKFLCVHKKLRLKRMTPVLIRELTRRVNQRGIHQAVYTAGTVLPTPLSSSSQWHRPLNPRKLMEVNYPGLRQNVTLQRALKFNRLPEVTKVRGLRPMAKEDVALIHTLLQKNLCNFHLSPILSLQEVEHWLLPREHLIDTYVVEADDGALTDVVSFYSISSRVLNHPVHAGLRAAHLLYIACTATEMGELMEDTLILAKSKGFDIFSALDVMDNRNFLDRLKFTVSDRSVHYYLYNWMCPPMSPDKVGLLIPN
ncbi:glycylpeptide N-tetradecanoyltransferase 1-like isoform X2 [Cololabis saira]|uniref:glycylpeptide N-tetradecanoyltransferase 1-like isoform X2 n=1 Tax=Cololabis saira TaxID=129043 RepID=UPI002AD2E8B5|nr:glycylpeptide N-tetradecanoyltransferase 1-like isoform X2 [Cololabis saira]